MAILTPCSCGVIFNLKSEYAGKLLQCPWCLANLRVPFIDRAQIADRLHVFANNFYLIRQNHFALATKYAVLDSNGQEVMFVERAARYCERILLFSLAFVVFSIVKHYAVTLSFLVIIMYYFINVKRDIKFYDNRYKDNLLLEVRQDKWLQLKFIHYTLYDHNGVCMGHFVKNRFTDILRRKWRFFTPDQKLVLVAQEDSLIASLLRRITGYFFDFVIFRTNFVFYAGCSEQVVGEFNKKISLFDRYTLDMSPDLEKLIDCRVALALGVLLDTGEGR